MQIQYVLFLGINRNIVECKCMFHHIVILRSDSINRNIVECKFINCVRKRDRFYCINRNIVECKCNRQHC